MSSAPTTTDIQTFDERIEAGWVADIERWAPVWRREGNPDEAMIPNHVYLAHSHYSVDDYIEAGWQPEPRTDLRAARWAYATDAGHPDVHWVMAAMHEAELDRRGVPGFEAIEAERPEIRVVKVYGGPHGPVTVQDWMRTAADVLIDEASKDVLAPAPELDMRCFVAGRLQRIADDLDETRPRWDVAGRLADRVDAGLDRLIRWLESRKRGAEWQCSTRDCGTWFRSAAARPECPDCGAPPIS